MVDNETDCFNGNASVYVKDANTTQIGKINADKLLQDTHQVYDIKRDKFVPIKHIVVTNNNKSFILIKKNSLGKDRPNQDFYVTAGHVVMYKGRPTKARDIPIAKPVKVKPEDVYSICTDVKTFISINNLHVLTWSHSEWLANNEKIKC